MKTRNISWIALLLLALPAVLPAQTGGFGRNKPHYENFDFEVYHSPHFELYTYVQNEEWLQNLLNDSEEWYRVHQRVLRDTIPFRNPLIIYANHPDFQQTNAISGTISTGTGGVTEAFKNRVVMPVAATNQQTHHVLGHELVHAFQYNMIIRGDGTKLQDLQNLPLWMVEGLAEYLSIGSVDPFTAMWMRDAVLHDDVPSLKDLSSSKYFPYRYGQAFWAFVTGLKGDDVIAPYFRATAKLGLEKSTPLVLGMTLKQLNELWEGALRKTYEPYVGDAKTDRNIGKELVSKDSGSGKINIAPAISPNGQYLIYLSERDLFSIDLFLADARTGETIRKIRTTSASGHVDELSYVENSGTWSPDSKQFAYTAVAKGRNVLIIADVEKGKSERSIVPEGVPAFSSPAWSPNGKSIVVAGQVEGHSDLFSIDVRSGRVTRLTNDAYSETHPAWSADGQTIYYATDRQAMLRRERPHGALRFNLATYDLVSGQSEDLPVFPGADNLNPVEGPDGKLYFLSNRDGFRNIYRYDLARGTVEQVTDLITGVSGITHFAPAMSIDRRNQRLVYSYFSQQGYRIHAALTDRLEGKVVPIDSVDLSPARLPRLNKQAPRVVDQLLENMQQEEVISSEQVQEVAYAPKFKLDYITGSAGAGVGTNPIFGTNVGAVGGVQAIFSDVLGDNQLFGTAMLNGELTDFGGSVGWINRKHRIQYGVSGGRVPFRSFQALAPRLEQLPINEDQFIEVGNAPYLINRLYQNQLGAFAQLPISTKLRVEASLSGSYYNNRVDEYPRYFDPLTGRQLNGNFRPERREDLEGDAFTLGTAGLALVGDAANFGLTSPINGYRYRLGVDQYLGEFQFTSVTADYRKYLWFGKGALAFRAMHQGRYGGNGNDLFPLYIGSPWYMRGLTGNDVLNQLAENGRNVNELIGSKLLVANLEVRIPFTGPKPLALIGSKLLFSDLNVFVDGGAAFTDFSQFGGPTFTLDRDGNPLIDPTTGEPFIASAGVRPIFTAGVSTRINVFGQIVIEPYLARPLLKNAGWSFGLNLQPGW
ncbi:PD40 domain-containing protein [Neolewinella lacunae]|uniref:PD40 domain-containing protein n=1 Tax=Neolewinella lacunae TaxID=1517758 RepID=A0A923T877_9BACT|nr:PD40 domain-containing protein [Neolewinella lacunae]MBC6994286.1 PD40 domain-containing protein [Neolewinella lacunae]MDN3635336.1 PD40 domain-containing protein [Neolewinella lacunae]